MRTDTEIKYEAAFRALRTAVIAKAEGDDQRLVMALFDIAERVLDDLHEIVVELRMIRKQNTTDGK